MVVYLNIYLCIDF